ncbi:MAG TPA: hypothetical protein VG475_11190, partial [Pseudolabrys sp.]|nr:hypothetical protein [Pseudolabrys sp.]
QIVEADGMPTLHVEWREQGGPPVAPPARRSFGTRLIERGVKAELGGRVEIAFARQGLRCDLDIPLASLAVKAGEG